MVLSIVLFAIGAIFGVIALQSILKNQPRPWTVVYLHGLFQVVAFVLLLAAAAGAVTAPTTAIVLFAITAVGGLILFALDRAKKPLPKALAVIHPILGVLGLIALIMFVAGEGDVAERAADRNGVGTDRDVVAPGTPPTTGTGGTGMGTTEAPGNTGAGGMGGTTGSGTMGGAGAVIDTGRTPGVSPDSGRLDDDRNRPGTQGQSGIGR